MTFGEKILERLADWRPAGVRAKSTLTDTGSGWTLTLTADRNDDVGCLLWELDWLRDATTGRAVQSLQAWAARLADAITSFVEPLKVIEVDPARDEAILRSSDAVHRGGSIRYYELSVRGTRELTLRRYRAHQDGKPREQITFGLTHETVASLADNIARA